jgi:DNA replication and repair protein RecF
MRIQSLALQDFRNFSAAAIKPTETVNIFYGDNGSGKTNLLEAIFVVCLGRSHRGAVDQVMLRTGADCYRIEGEIETADGPREAAVAYRPGCRKRITIDKVMVPITELYDSFCTVAAGPEDSEILCGAPAVRRSFIDIYLSQFSKKYLVTLIDYRKVLGQKNAALRVELDPSPFDELLIAYGSEIVRARSGFLQALRTEAARFYTGIAGSGTLDLVYEPSIGPLDDAADVTAIGEAFRRKLVASAVRERAVQASLVGPHRDEIACFIEGWPARTHGSQGQWRSAAVSLKLAVYRMLSQQRATMPVLLLDEIFAELDPGRTAGLIAAFENLGQLFLTTALEPPLALRRNSRSFRIKKGVVEDVS